MTNRIMEYDPVKEEKLVQEYTLPGHITDKVIAAANNGKGFTEAAIVGVGGWFNWSNQEEGTSGKKPFIEVQVAGLNDTFQYRMPASIQEDFISEFGTHDRRKWVGARIKFKAEEKGQRRWVSATIIQFPQDVSMPVPEVDDAEDLVELDESVPVSEGEADEVLEELE